MLIKETIPSSLEKIPPFVSNLMSNLKPFLDQEQAFDVRISLEEALVNAVKHGNRFNPELWVEIEAEVCERAMVLKVSDQGSGFDYTNLSDPTQKENLTRPAGRGIFLIRHLMDEVEFLDGGRTIRMVKFLRKQGGKNAH